MQGHILRYLRALRAGGLRSRICSSFLTMNRKAVSIVMAIVVVLSSGLVAVVPAVTRASETDVLGNGSFEHGFVNYSRLWRCRHRLGTASPTEAPRTTASTMINGNPWSPTVITASSSRSTRRGLLRRMPTATPASRRRFALPEARQVHLQHARHDPHDRHRRRDPYRYVVQVGWADGPNASWKDVTTGRTQDGTHTSRVKSPAI